ncbi:NmrA family NAD(P)-binding protein [Stigmatella sp. ncwal1]|uniref:NmrA family NAD(P)-binding protein n=1 Tax=Stigmatella ashevillensis TaxID=2995309 RepID=A0ABT5DI07_9BACT|nr:NmrA family NAD(P)-binding protein [Stigmatella ashevillena]MDC0713291.1 NmrA family NAD(P)-binding protein [Stigmatella ashevillena]
MNSMQWPHFRERRIFLLVASFLSENAMSIVINTPNGTIGRGLAEKLLAAGKSLTVISRSPDKVAVLAKRGARVVEGSIDEQPVLERALAGAEALFWLTPPAARPDYHAWAVQAARAAAQSVKAHGVGRVVVLSSVGAQSGPGTGPVGVMKEVEAAFLAVSPNVTVMRPGFFMENLLRNLDTIAKAGAIFQPFPAAKRVPMVASEDIAAKAAEVFLDAAWKGHRYLGVHGPQDLSHLEVAEILSRELGQPVRYTEVTLEQARQGMLGAGMPGFLADLLLEMYQAIPEGRMDAAEPRTAETTTPTTLAHFAQEVLRPKVAAFAR